MTFEPENVSGRTGYWLKGSSIEAFVTTAPRIRLAVLRTPGRDNVLGEVNESLLGMKTWLMNPHEDLTDRSEFSELPAHTAEATPAGLTLETAPSAKLGLSLRWEVSVNEKEDGIIVTQTIQNHSEIPQDVAAWSLMIFSENTHIDIPLDSPAHVERDKNPYQLFVYPYSSINDPRMSINDGSLALQVSKAPESGALKVGVVSVSGTAYAKRSGQVLESTVSFDPEGTYPEGGPNITAFVVGNEKNTFGELEHMSPIKRVIPGDQVSMTQHLVLSQR